MANVRMPLNEARRSSSTASAGTASAAVLGTDTGGAPWTARASSPDASGPRYTRWGYLPEFHPDVTDYSVAGGFRGATHGWSVDLGASFGHKRLQIQPAEHPQRVARAVLEPGRAVRAGTRIASWGTQTIRESRTRRHSTRASWRARN